MNKNMRVGDDITTGGEVIHIEEDGRLLVKLPATTVWIKAEDVKSWRPNSKGEDDGTT